MRPSESSDVDRPVLRVVRRSNLEALWLRVLGGWWVRGSAFSLCGPCVCVLCVCCVRWCSGLRRLVSRVLRVVGGSCFSVVVPSRSSRLCSPPSCDPSVGVLRVGLIVSGRWWDRWWWWAHWPGHPIAASVGCRWCGECGCHVVGMCMFLPWGHGVCATRYPYKPWEGC